MKKGPWGKADTDAKKPLCNLKANCRGEAKLLKVVDKNGVAMAFPLSSAMQVLPVTEQSLNRSPEGFRVAY